MKYLFSFVFIIHNCLYFSYAHSTTFQLPSIQFYSFSQTSHRSISLMLLLYDFVISVFDHCKTEFTIMFKPVHMDDKCFLFFFWLLYHVFITIQFKIRYFITLLTFICIYSKMVCLKFYYLLNLFNRSLSHYSSFYAIF